LRIRQHLSSALVFLVAALLVYLLGTALLMARPMWRMMGFGSGWAAVALLLMLPLTVGIVRLVGGNGRAHGGLHDDPALDILRRRYAAGEITREEYERMRGDLARQASGEGNPTAEGVATALGPPDRNASQEVKRMGDNAKVLLGAIVGALVVLLLLAILRGGGMMGMGSMMGGGMMGGGMFGILFMLLFWVLVIALIAALIFWLFNQSQR